MKKYHSLGVLLTDFRKHRNMTQLDLAAVLDVDVRTVIRWEKNESLIKPDKEKILIESLGIPHQVIRNLNTDHPISVYFNFKQWSYALSLLSSMVKSSLEFETDVEFETNRIVPLSNAKDIEFIRYIQENQNNRKPLLDEVVKEAALLFPELNLVIKDQSGYHGGHISILPLKYETYELLRNQKIQEHEIKVSDLSGDPDRRPLAFYFYSLYSNSLDNTHYLMNKILYYFKSKRLDDYIFAGITYRSWKVARFMEMGFHINWQKKDENDPEQTVTFICGNFNDFLFRKENQ